MSRYISDSAANKSYTAEEIQAWIVSHISKQLGVKSDEIDVTEPLDSYGLDSAQIMILASQAGNFLGFQLSPLLLWHYPTIESLSQRLSEELETSDSEIFEI